MVGIVKMGNDLTSWFSVGGKSISVAELGDFVCVLEKVNTNVLRLTQSLTLIST